MPLILSSALGCKTNTTTIEAGIVEISLENLQALYQNTQFIIPAGKQGMLSIIDENQNMIRCYTAPLNMTGATLLKEARETLSQASPAKSSVV